MQLGIFTEKQARHHQQYKIHIPSKAKNVFDVSGAGDTVISCFGAAICNENSVRDSLEFANIAAGNVVGKFGTAPVCLEEL